MNINLLRAALAMTLLAAAGCSGTDGGGIGEGSGGPGEESIAARSPEAAPYARQVRLSFAPVPADREPVRAVDRLDEGAEIVKEQTAAGGTALFYVKADDAEHVYAGFRTPQGLFDLGAVGGRQSVWDDETLSAAEVDVDGATLLRTKGVYGSNAPVQRYFAINEGTVVPVLRIDVGHAVPADLDGDGTTEFVASHGTPLRTYIYKRESGGYFAADLNEALQALSVLYGEDGTFLAQLEGGPETVRYEYDAGTLRPAD